MTIKKTAVAQVTIDTSHWTKWMIDELVSRAESINSIALRSTENPQPEEFRERYSALRAWEKQWRSDTKFIEEREDIPVRIRNAIRRVRAYNSLYHSAFRFYFWCRPGLNGIPYRYYWDNKIPPSFREMVANFKNGEGFPVEGIGTIMAKQLIDLLDTRQEA